MDKVKILLAVVYTCKGQISNKLKGYSLKSGKMLILNIILIEMQF